jgi:hypothetical protein
MMVSCATSSWHKPMPWAVPPQILDENPGSDLSENQHTDLRRLHEGFEIEIHGAFIVIRAVPM